MLRAESWLEIPWIMRFCFLSFWFRYLWILLSFPFVTVEDVSDLWPTVKGLFEEHQPLKRAFLTNRTRNPVLVENLPVEFILTTDARLRSRSPQEQYLFWFREPYATIVLVTCEVLVLLLSFVMYPLSFFAVLVSIITYLVKLCLWHCRILMSLKTFLSHVWN